MELLEQKENDTARAMLRKTMVTIKYYNIVN